MGKYEKIQRKYRKEWESIEWAKGKLVHRQDIIQQVLLSKILIKS